MDYQVIKCRENNNGVIIIRKYSDRECAYQVLCCKSNGELVYDQNCSKLKQAYVLYRECRTIIN